MPPTDTAHLPKSRAFPFLLYLFTLSSSALLFTAATLWFIHAHRTEIITRSIADYVSPYQLSIGSVDIDRSGRIRLESVTVSDPADANTRFELGHADWDWKTKSLLASRYGEFDLNAPHISIGPKTFAAWMEPGTPDPHPIPTPGAAKKPLVETLVLSLQKIGISAGKFDFTADGYPKVSFDFEYFGDEIGLDSGLVSADSQRLQIRNFEAVFTAPDSPPTSIRFAGLDLEFHAEHDPSLLDITTASFTDLEIHITPSILAYASILSSAPPDPDQPALSHTVFARLFLEQLDLPNITFNVSGFGDATPPFPDLDSNSDLHFQNLAIDLVGNTFSIGRHTLGSRNLDLRLSAAPGHLRFQSFALSASNITGTGATVDTFTLNGADLDLTEALLRSLTPSSDPTTSEPGVQTTPTFIPDIAVKQFEIPDAQISASAIPGLPEISFTFSTTLSDWTMADDEATSPIRLPDTPQSILVSDLRVGGEDAEPPLASIDLAALLINPATFARTRQIEALHLISPHIHLTPENIPAPEDTQVTSPPAETPPNLPPGSQIPLWHGITITDFAIEDGDFEIKEQTVRGVPAVHFDFSAETKTTGSTPTYIVSLTEITSTIKSFQEKPFQSTRALTFTLNTDDLWNEHTFTEVDFDGMSGVMAQELLDALQNLADTPEPAPKPKPEPAPEQAKSPELGSEVHNPHPAIQIPFPSVFIGIHLPSVLSAALPVRFPFPVPNLLIPEIPELPAHKKPWKIGRLRVRNSTVTLRGIAPGLPPVTVGIKADLKGVPVSPDAFLGDLREHRVEIDKIKLPSYYNPLVNVAVLENIWVDFTLDGIAKQTIENVIVGSPTIYVGEHLFWYIDFYRKFLDESAPAEGSAEAPTPVPPPDGADPTVSGPKTEPGPEAILIPNAAAEEVPGWNVTRLQALNGKLVVAPKGTIVPGFPYPFPFSADTTLQSGELHSEFTVPNGTYELEDIKLRIADLHGSVEFNLPFKQINNNLTETLEAKHLRFHQMEAENLWVTVTYDSYGIYAKFGGEMYGGYLKGEFNIYLDTQYTWDAWVTGSDIDTDPLTAAITPEYFKMDAPIDFAVVATGNASELYQATGTLESKKPGKMTIEALNDAISAIPGDWIHLEKRITEIGLETLRDFDYESVTGSFRLYGREGTVDLDLRGAFGSRRFKINIHDYRRPELDPELFNIKKPDQKPPQHSVTPDLPPPPAP